MGRFSTILFDLDGTLVDPGPGIEDSIRYVLGRLGVAPPPGNLRWCVGPPLREIFSKLLPPSAQPQDLERAVSLYLERHAAVGLHQSVVYPGIGAMLVQLRDSARLFVVTAKVAAHAEQILRARSLRGYFELVAGSSPDGRLTDKADALASVLAGGKIAATSAVIVGDRAHDILAGKRNGVFTIGVTYGYGTIPELTQSGADQICDDPAAVAGFLDSE
jgi:phosphoglycolate phosphatase